MAGKKNMDNRDAPRAQDKVIERSSPIYKNRNYVMDETTAVPRP